MDINPNPGGVTLNHNSMLKHDGYGKVNSPGTRPSKEELFNKISALEQSLMNLSNRLLQENRCLREELVRVKTLSEESKKEIESLRELIRPDDGQMLVDGHAIDLNENLEDISFTDLFKIADSDYTENAATEDGTTKEIKNESYNSNVKIEEPQRRNFKNEAYTENFMIEQTMNTVSNMNSRPENNIDVRNLKEERLVINIASVEGNYKPKAEDYQEQPKEHPLTRTEKNTQTDEFKVASVDKERSYLTSTPVRCEEMETLDEEEEWEITTDEEEECHKEEAFQAIQFPSPPNESRRQLRQLPQKKYGQTEILYSNVEELMRRKRGKCGKGKNAPPKIYCICRKPETPKMIGCDFCDEWYHTNCLNFSEERVQELLKEKWPCPKCETKPGINSGSSIQNPNATTKSFGYDEEKQKKNLICNTCGFKTSHREEFDTHLKEAHNRSKKYSCKQCHFKAFQKSNVERHVKSIHNQIKDIACTQCDFRTAQKFSLDRHMNAIHLKLKEYPCPDCSFKTAQKSNLDAHQKMIHCYSFRK